MSLLKGANVLVTGAGGFIGRYLTAALIDSGATVTGLTVGGIDSGGSVRWIPGDITRPGTLSGVCDGIDVIYHLAAISNVARSIQDPFTTINTNTMGTANLLEEARKSKVKKFVYISSAHVYGAPRYVPVDEAHPLSPREPYAASKIASENIVQAYGNAYGMGHAIVRPFNVYGPGQDTSFLIPGVIAQALNDGKIMIGNLEPTRDFLFVGDAVSGFVTIGGKGSGVYNIGSGEEVRVLDVVTMIRDLVDPSIPMVSDEGRIRAGKVEIPRMCADISRLKGLGWSPSGNFREGLALTVEAEKRKKYGK